MEPLLQAFTHASAPGRAAPAARAEAARLAGPISEPLPAGAPPGGFPGSLPGLPPRPHNPLPPEPPARFDDPLPPAPTAEGAGEEAPEFLPDLEPDLSNPAVRAVVRAGARDSLWIRLAETLCFERKFGAGRVPAGRAFVCFVREIARGALLELAAGERHPGLAAEAFARMVRYEDRLDEQLERQNAERVPVHSEEQLVRDYESESEQREHLEHARQWWQLARTTRNPTQYFLQMERAHPAVVDQLGAPGAGRGKCAVAAFELMGGLWQVLHARTGGEQLRRASALYRALLAGKHWRLRARTAWRGTGARGVDPETGTLPPPVLSTGAPPVPPGPEPDETRSGPPQG